PRAYLLLSETDGKQQRPFIPDVGVSTAGPDRTTKTSVAVAEPTTDTEPQTLRAFVAEEYRETFLEIYEVEPEWRLVTCIEVLPPSTNRPNTTGWDGPTARTCCWSAAASKRRCARSGAGTSTSRCQPSPCRSAPRTQTCSFRSSRSLMPPTLA